MSDVDGLGDDLDIDEEEFLEEMEEIDEEIFETVTPVLDDMQARHPNHNVWLAMLAHSLYELFYMGITKEEIIEEIGEQYDIFAEEGQVPPNEMLH